MTVRVVLQLAPSAYCVPVGPGSVRIGQAGRVGKVELAQGVEGGSINGFCAQAWCTTPSC